jgi:hypothetical protein
MTKKEIAIDNRFTQLRNLSEYAGALKAGLEFKKMIMADESMEPHLKMQMVKAIDDAIKYISPKSELSDITVGDVITKIENNEAI